MTGQCDCCCAPKVELTRTWVHGIETFACNACCGWPDDPGDAPAPTVAVHITANVVLALLIVLVLAAVFS
jgi:hypothetical protein